MTEQEKDNIYFVCCMIEVIGRKTKNRRHDVAMYLRDGLAHELEYADITHCLPMEQAAEEWIESYNIPDGSYDTLTGSEYDIPSSLSIGRVYQNLVLNTVASQMEPVKAIEAVFSSPIIDNITDFDSGVYYRSPSYLQYCYEKGELEDYYM
ncbi:MAG: hypothetical protein J6N51_11790 [Selenomonas sp.]|nr:hypothetical protein [Selenomonas sp.]